MQGNNFLKIITNLAVVIYDCTQNIQYACLELAFGPRRLYVGNSIVLQNSILFEILKQINTIYKVFNI